QYVKDYTQEMLDQSVICSDCDKYKYIIEGNSCDDCSKYRKEQYINNQKIKNELKEKKKEKEKDRELTEYEIRKKKINDRYQIKKLNIKCSGYNNKLEKCTRYTDYKYCSSHEYFEEFSEDDIKNILEGNFYQCNRCLKFKRN